MGGKVDFEHATGFIFDCDGTLLDTLDAWSNAERDLFAQIPYKLTIDQEDAIHSAPIKEAARLFHESYGVGESNEAVLEHLDDALLSYYANEAEPLPGACELVRKVNALGIPCVVVSSSPDRYLDAGLRRAGIRDCFTALVSTETVGVSKQDPRIYQAALDAMGAEAATTWAIDDAPYACRAMAEFGLHTIAPVNGAGAERRARQEAEAEIVVDTLEELV